MSRVLSVEFFTFSAYSAVLLKNSENGGFRYGSNMHFTIETKKSKDEILQIIRDNTYIRTSLFDYSKGDEYFEGEKWRVLNHPHG